MKHVGHRFGLALVLLNCLGLVCHGQEAEKKEAQQDQADAKSVSQESTHDVKPQRLKIEVELTGVFEATQMWPVAFHPNSWSSFTVVKAVPHGKRVQKGDTLVWLDMSEIDEQLQDLEHAQELGKLSRRLATTELELLQKTIPLDLKAAERSNRIADEDLNYFMKTDRAFQMESAEFSLKSSRDSLEYAQEELKQLEKMYKADDLTEETEEIVLKRARNDVERAKFYLKSAELRYKRSMEQELPREEQQLVESAQRSELALAKSTVSLPVQLEKQKIELEKQQLADRRDQKKLTELRQDREMMAVRSPADGYVYYGKCTRGKWSSVDSVAGQLTEGGKLSPQNVFMTVVHPRPLRIRVDVPEKELHRLSRNVKGTAVPDGFPEMELKTAYEEVSPLPVAKGIFDGLFQVTVGDEARQIVPGMGCKVTLIAYDKPDAIAVPASAVFEDEADGQRNIVYVKRGDQEPEKRKVVIGQKTEAKWEVLRGLKEGEQILLKKPEAS